MIYSGWMIPDEERDILLNMFPPRYELVRASHITHNRDEIIPSISEIRLCGIMIGPDIEAFIVSVDDNIYRPDSKIYHCTWSFSTGRSSKDSNESIAEYGWTKIDPIKIKTRPFISRNNQYITTELVNC